MGGGGISHGLLVPNPGLQGERPATNSLSHGKASKREIQLNNTYTLNSYPVIRTNQSSTPFF